jgi:hypothetical protein
MQPIASQGNASSRHAEGKGIRSTKAAPGHRIGINHRKAKKWSERQDLNLRPPVPQTGALTGLRYAP